MNYIGGYIADIDAVKHGCTPNTNVTEQELSLGDN